MDQLVKTDKISCADCERLRVKPRFVCTSPERTQFIQSTMYDHMKQYKSYQQYTEDEKKRIVPRGPAILKIDSRLTNWTPSFHTLKSLLFTKFVTEMEKNFEDPLASCFELHESIISSGILPKKLNELAIADVPSSSQVKKPHEIPDLDVADTFEKAEDKASLNLIMISRVPTTCPLPTCNRIIGITSILSHFINHKVFDNSMECKEIYKDSRMLLMSDISDLQQNEVRCLGVLCYGGDKLDVSSRPVIQKQCLRNSLLTPSDQHLEFHWPVLIMVAKTTWHEVLMPHKKFNIRVKDNELDPSSVNIKKYDSGDNQEEGKMIILDPFDPSLLIVFWLIGTEILTPMHATFTIIDRHWRMAMSSVLKIRNFQESRDPKDMAMLSTECLRLGTPMYNKLTYDRSNPIFIEIMIHDYEDEMKNCSSDN